MTATVKKARTAILISCVIAMFFAGTVYSWSIFVSSFEAEFGWARSQTSLTYTIMITFNTTMGVLAAFLSRKIPFRWIIRIGAVVGALGLFLVSNMQALPELYLGFGACFGGAMGFVYNACAASVVRWFPENPSGISGILLMAYGFSSMLLGPLYNAGIERFGWRRLFLIISLVCLVLLLACSLFNRMPSDAEAAALPEPKQAGDTNTAASIRPGKMIRMPLFWMYFLWQVLVAACGMTLSGHAAPMAVATGATAAVAAFFVGLQSGGSGIGRVLFGFVYDRIGRRTLFFVNLIPILGALLLFFAFRGGVLPLLGFSFLLLGVGFGGSPVSATGFTKYTFGAEHYATNLSIVNLSALVASFFGPYVGALVYEKSGYGMVCGMMLLLAVAALLIVFPIMKKK